jgi:hypothetical protein
MQIVVSVRYYAGETLNRGFYGILQILTSVFTAFLTPPTFDPVKLIFIYLIKPGFHGFCPAGSFYGKIDQRNDQECW